jgi:uncharacterized protein (TIGR03435 family)
MRRLTVCFLSVAFFVSAQTSTKRPEFAVASVKPSPAGGPATPEMVRPTPDGFSMQRVTLLTCLKWAYHIQGPYISGPAFLKEGRFDIQAKAAGPASIDDLRLMLQELLAQRFKVTAHWEDREIKGFALGVAKNGPKLTESPGDSKGGITRRGTAFIGNHVPMSMLANMLSSLAEFPVVDRTGIKGYYDFSVDVAEYVAQSSKSSLFPGVPTAGSQPPFMDTSRSSIDANDFEETGLFNVALQAKLGLRLDVQKIPASILIVDRAEKTPTEN